MWISGRFNPDTENLPVEDPWHSWHILRRHLGPLTVPFGINYGSRTTSCWPHVVKPIEVGATVSHNDEWCTTAHYSHRWSSISSGHSSLRHEKHNQKINSHCKNFFWVKMRKMTDPAARLVSYPWGQSVTGTTSEVLHDYKCHLAYLSKHLM